MIAIVAAMVVCLSIGVPSPAQSDFAGRWTLEPDPPPAGQTPGGRANAPRGDMGSGWGSTITITQNPFRLVVEYAFFGRGDMQPPMTLTYALDGSESRNTVMMGRGPEVQVSRARWDGSTLVITTAFAFANPASGKPVLADVTRRLRLDSPTSLVVEVTRGGVLGGQPTTTTSVYRK